MPSLINRVPPGLLSMLGTKAMGVNPSILPDTVQPTVELLPFYAAVNSENLTATPSVSAVGAITLASVPAGELWLVEGLVVTTDAVLGAGVTLRIGPAHWNGSVYIRIYEQFTFTAGERVGTSIATAGADRFFAGPGQTIGAWCSNVVAGPVTARLSALITRLVI